jgi:hypothetical protein
MSIVMIITISVANNHWLVHICINLEVLLMDPISRHKVGTRTIHGLSGNKITKRTILEDYVATKSRRFVCQKPLLLLPII